MNVRAKAALALAPILRGESSLQTLEYDAAADARDGALFYELVLGGLRHYEYLAAIAEQLLTKSLRKKDADVQALLLLGLYQLKFLRTPDHAAIGETVAATSQLKKAWAKGLVNAALRRFQREASILDARVATNETVDALCPSWLLHRLQDDWPDRWRDIVAAMSCQAPLSLRVNRQLMPRDEASDALRAAGVEHRLCQHAQQGISLESSRQLSKLKGLSEGWLSVQDEAAQLAAPLLQLGDDMRILDACAAPGGKTTHLRELAPEAEIVALDHDARRLERVAENLQRLKQTAELKHADAAKLAQWWDEQPFDRILLDAPCSATGIIRRHPDIKLLRQPDDLAKLAQLQHELLTSLWPSLKPGGLLLYATCSVLRQENEHVIEHFVAQHSDAEHCDIQADWGEARRYGRQLFPQIGGHDGFYYALLRKSI